MSIDDKIKEHIGYTKAPADKCQSCKHCTEDEDQNIDRMWNHHCRIAENITVLRVDPNGRCNKYESAK